MYFISVDVWRYRMVRLVSRSVTREVCGKTCHVTFLQIWNTFSKVNEANVETAFVQLASEIIAFGMYEVLFCGFCTVCEMNLLTTFLKQRWGSAWLVMRWNIKPHGTTTGINETWYLSFFSELCRESLVLLKYKETGALHKDLLTFMLKSYWMFLELEMFRFKVVLEIKTCTSCSITFFTKIVR